MSPAHLLARRVAGAGHVALVGAAVLVDIALRVSAPALLFASECELTSRQLNNWAMQQGRRRGPSTAQWVVKQVVLVR